MTDTRPVSLVVEMRIDIPDFSEGQFGEYGDPEGHALLLSDIITKFASNRGGFASGEVRVEKEEEMVEALLLPEERYVLGGGVACPICGEASFEREPFHLSESESLNGATWNVRCNSCDAEFTEEYALVHVVIHAPQT